MYIGSSDCMIMTTFILHLPVVARNLLLESSTTNFWSTQLEQETGKIGERTKYLYLLPLINCIKQPKLTILWQHS